MQYTFTAGVSVYIVSLQSKTSTCTAIIMYEPSATVTRQEEESNSGASSSFTSSYLQAPTISLTGLSLAIAPFDRD